VTFPVLTRRPDSGLGNIRSSPGDPLRNVDWVLLVASAAIAVIGVAAIYSSTRPVMIRRGLDPFLFTERQVVFLIVAAVAMVVIMSFDYRWLAERAGFFYGATLLALVLVLLVGAVKNGARLSFDIGPIAVQPAELAKFTVLLFLAQHLSEERSEQVSYPRFVTGLVLVGVPIALIVIQPDLGGASVLMASAMGVLLVAGAKFRYIALISVMSLMTVAAALLAGLVDRYQLRRIEAFVNQNSSDENLQSLVFQVRYAKRAVGTGGLTGKGWLEAPLTNGGYIPLQWSDFVFSAVAEQFGIIGGGLLLGLYAIVLMRIWRTAHLAKDMLGTFLCTGVFTMLLWQVFQNVGMTMGIMPVTGLPLPLVSYGGSGAVVWAMLIGLVQSVHMRRMR
jgi:rod shape determining protein RodA